LICGLKLDPQPETFGGLKSIAAKPYGGMPSRGPKSISRKAFSRAKSICGPKSISRKAVSRAKSISRRKPFSGITSHYRQQRGGEITDAHRRAPR